MWRTYALANPYEMGSWHSASVSKLIVACVSLEKYFISGSLLYILNHRYGAVLCVPDVYDESGVNHRKRIFDEVHKYIGIGLATFESFPSGDSCQASQWATLLWLLCTSTPVHCLIALATDLEHSGIRVCTELREVCHLLQPVTLSWIMAGRVTIHSPASRSCSGD